MSERRPASTPATPSVKQSSPQRTSLSAIKAAMRKKNRTAQSEQMTVFDPFAASHEAKNMIRGQTGLVFDAEMAEHSNPWDGNHIECPERLLKAKARCDELGLSDQCQEIKGRFATEDEMLLAHSKEYLDLLESMFVISYTAFLIIPVFQCYFSLNICSCFTFLKQYF